MTLTLILRKDGKGRYWLSVYRGEACHSTFPGPRQITSDMALMLEAIADQKHSDGQMTLWR